MSKELDGYELVYANVLSELHKRWTPHQGQIDLGRPLFTSRRDVFGQCGRNFGKTDFVAYALWRWALLNPGSENYYFAPFMKQAREILWASRRIQNFGPSKWIKSVNNSEMRIIFTNDSFIKLDGSDNVDAYRGIKPKGLSVFDEFKDFRPEFYDAYDPNRATHQSPLVIIGTPPDRECQFLEVASEFKKNENKHFYHGPTSANPYIGEKWLKAKELEYIQKGEEDAWQREYLAEYVPGGISKVFSGLSRDHVVPHEQLVEQTLRDHRKLSWHTTADPAGSSVFAVLFSAIHPYKKEVYVFDELYIEDQSSMSVGQVGPLILEKKRELDQYSRFDWIQTYDEAESWFYNEMHSQFNEFFQPTRKAMNKKEHGISLIKDLLHDKKVLISDRCVKLFWEMDNYYRDKNGKLPKLRDHLIDCFRYTLDASHYSINEEVEYKWEEDENVRYKTIQDEISGVNKWGEPISDELDPFNASNVWIGE